MPAESVTRRLRYISLMEWYAVRCILRHGWESHEHPTYEERVTLWRAKTAEDAIELAIDEAVEYCEDITTDESPSEYVGLAQSYWLDDTPGHGAEVFSMMRDSTLDPDEYISWFFSDGSERVRDLEDD